MGTDSNDNEPLIVSLLDARRIRFRIGKVGNIDLLRLFNLFLGSVEDEYWLRPPEHLDDLPIGYRGEVDIDRCAGRNGRSVGIHLRDQWHQYRSGAHRADGAGGYIEKVAARVLRRRHGRHVFGPLLRLAKSSAHGWSPGPKSRGGGGGPVAAALEKAGQRVGRVLLAPLPCKRKPAQVRPASLATSFAPRRGLNVTLCARSGRPIAALELARAPAPARISRINRSSRAA